MINLNTYLDKLFSNADELTACVLSKSLDAATHEYVTLTVRETIVQSSEVADAD